MADGEVAAADAAVDAAKLEKIKFHGAMGDPKWENPKLAVRCDEINRVGYEGRKAHEYLDHDAVLRKKVGKLAEMIRKSKKMVVYSGAGISTSAGIPDYGTKSKDSLVKKAQAQHKGSIVLCFPTLSHFVLTQMHREGYLKHWIQQNHDGLPQKAGFPQKDMNEIHGAWFDPSNPVVQFSGNLRDDLFDDLLQWEKSADLCLAVGTSLCGMNADRVVTSTAKRYTRKGRGQGSVIVNLQETQYDHLCSLRIFAKLDDVMRLLAKELGLQKEAYTNPKLFVPDVPALALQNHVFMVPYDEQGQKCDELRPLVLAEGAKIRITSGKFKGDEGEVVGTNEQGQYRLRCYVRVKDSFYAWSPMLFGSWWVHGAVRGELAYLPVVSV